MTVDRFLALCSAKKLFFERRPVRKHNLPKLVGHVPAARLKRCNGRVLRADADRPRWFVYAFNPKWCCRKPGGATANSLPCDLHDGLKPKWARYRCTP